MSAGKGDSPRNCFSREYRENWGGIFSCKEKSESSTCHKNVSKKPKKITTKRK
jgi:hypothetical protein